MAIINPTAASIVIIFMTLCIVNGQTIMQMVDITRRRENEILTEKILLRWLQLNLYQTTVQNGCSRQRWEIAVIEIIFILRQSTFYGIEVPLFKNTMKENDHVTRGNLSIFA